MRLIAVVALVVATAVLFPVHSARAGGSSLSLTTWRSREPVVRYVEQESPNYFDNNCGGISSGWLPPCDPTTWVTNPTVGLPVAQSCDWDVDDSIDVSGQGTLAAGVTTGSVCMISDQYQTFSGDPHNVQVMIDSLLPNLTVTLASDRGDFYTATPVAVTYWLPATRNWYTGYRYNICQHDAGPGVYPVVDGSNGGTGVVGHWTMMVTNPTGRSTKNAFVVLQTGFQGYGAYGTGCPGSPW